MSKYLHPFHPPWFLIPPKRCIGTYEDLQSFSEALGKNRSLTALSISVNIPLLPSFLSPQEIHLHVYFPQGLQEIEIIPAIIASAMNIPDLQRLSIEVVSLYFYLLQN